MKYWLVKSEPNTWSWQEHVEKGVEPWDGVRNHQAKQNLRVMSNGDHAFFYHSGQDKRIVGTLTVVRQYYPDPTDESGKFGMVDFKADQPLKTSVTLAQIKAQPRLGEMTLVKNSRLSVQPVDASSWKLICRMGRIKP